MRIQLDIPDPLYAEIAHTAAASGQSVERVMVDRLSARVDDDLPDSFWTPERLAELRAANAEIDAGNFFTVDQLEAELVAKRATWLERHR